MVNNSERAQLKVESMDDAAFRTRVTRVIVSDLKANGPIRLAMLGLFEVIEKEFPALSNEDGSPKTS